MISIVFFQEEISILKLLTAQKMKFSSKNFSSKYDQIRSKLRIWSHLQKKSLMENFIFCVVCHPEDLLQVDIDTANNISI